ncbi:MAG: hypothetical protein J6X66_07330 [Lachnospiraceae bacterium]|nr:hypothetical protein [Lachnospiraceae bacterium]
MKTFDLKSDNRGVAMMVCITIIAILMIFCLSLLSVTYSLYSSQNNSMQQEKNAEAAKSLAMAIRQDLTADTEDSLLSRYLRYNIVAESDALVDPGEVWPHYEAGVSGHEEKDAKRYFTLQKSDYADIKGKPSDIGVCMWWTLPAEDDVNDSVELYVEVKCRSGSQSYVILSRYALETDGSKRSKYNRKYDQYTINPGHKEIDTKYIWRWKYLESE